MFRNQKIVVVMPAYNAAQTLRRTYDEVVEQGIVDAIILVDDADFLVAEHQAEKWASRETFERIKRET